jgi:predicted dehydrogenase
MPPLGVGIVGCGRISDLHELGYRKVAEANRMIEAAERAGVTLRIYENFVFYPPHVRAKQMLETGEIGEPQMICIHLGARGPGGAS